VKIVTFLVDHGPVNPPSVIELITADARSRSREIPARATTWSISARVSTC
jgi:hypothetical protein